MKARKNDVCLLYSESDQPVAEHLEYCLNYYSIDVWKTQNIPIGNRIVSETTRVLEQAKVVIVLWSNQSVKSALLKRLASDAKRDKKVLIPVLIEDTQIPGEFIDIQPINLIGWNRDKESEQIVRLWVLIREEVLVIYKRRVRFNRVIAILGLIVALVGVIVNITTPELRCLLNLGCPSENTLNEDISVPQENALERPSETLSPSPSSIPEQQDLSQVANHSSLPSSLRTQCITEPPPGLLEEPQTEMFNEIISVNKQARNPDIRHFLHINQTRLETCQLLNQNLNPIKFIYAIPDNSRLEQVKISFYLDGQLAQSLSLGRGEIKSASLNMQDIRSYAIEVTAVQGRDDFLYFLSNSN